MSWPQEVRDFDLLSGYLAGIDKEFPEDVASFKARAAEADVLAPALPLVCWRLGIVASDIPLVLAALHAGRLPPWPLMQWTLGRTLDAVEAHAVAPLFDALLDHSVEGYAVALDLVGMYAFGRHEVLEDFRPQLRKYRRESQAVGARRAPCQRRASLRDPHAVASEDGSRRSRRARCRSGPFPGACGRSRTTPRRACSGHA